MDFKAGDQVIHWAFGPGEILELDEKCIDNRATQYYVVQTKDLIVWVPIDEAERNSLRYPTPAKKFEQMFDILQGQGEELSEDRTQRRMQLAERMQDRRLEAICGVIRDLNAFGQQKKMNENDHAVMERASKFLLEEWRISFGISLHEAQHELERMLKVSSPPAKQAP